MLGKFFEGQRFNFLYFFAFYIFTICAGIWLFIIISDRHADNPHVAEIRTICGNISLLIIGFFFGASQGSKRKDEVIQDIVTSNVKKDEALKTMVQDAKDIANTAPINPIPSKVDVTIKDAKDEPNKDILGKEL